MEGWSFSEADTQCFQAIALRPDASRYPHLYRWYIHIVALQSNHTSFSESSGPPPPLHFMNKDETNTNMITDEQQEEEKEAAELLSRLTLEAQERTLEKEAKQRTLVVIEIKPFDIEQDLMELWNKIVTNIKQDGLKWGQSCTLVPVAFGIKKIQTTFVMGIENSSEDIAEAIQEAYADEVQSVEIISMNVV